MMNSETEWTISHDFAFAFGGAERVTAHLSDLIPEAPVQILAGSQQVIERMGLAGASTTLFPQLNHRSYRYAALALPRMLGRRSPLRGNLLSSSYAFAHMVPVLGKRVVYCHSPFRQVWSGVEAYTASLPRPLSACWKHVVAPTLRRHDRLHAARADAYIATSTAVARRIEDYYDRPVTALVPPPVAGIFRPRSPQPTQPSTSFLWVGRIVEPYKRLRLAIETFRRLPELTLRVVGDGRDRAALEKLSPPNVTFMGDRGSAELAEEYTNAAAVIFPSEDDFGMVMAESISSGTPVIAFGGGGALDIVEEGITGTLFRRPTEDSLRDAVQRFRATTWKRELIAERGQRFHLEHFETNMRQVLRMVADDKRPVNVP